jgi:hypothetical protein
VRFYDVSLKGQWKSIIQAKYKNYIITSRFSPFWKSILKNKDLIDLGFNKIVGSGSTISFWHDGWFNECALYCFYPLLYSIVVHPKKSAANAYKSVVLTLEFRRQLVDSYLQEWIHLHSLVGIMVLNSMENDIFIWRWHS